MMPVHERFVLLVSAFLQHEPLSNPSEKMRILKEAASLRLTPETGDDRFQTDALKCAQEFVSYRLTGFGRPSWMPKLQDGWTIPGPHHPEAKCHGCSLTWAEHFANGAWTGACVGFRA